ncbi:MAG TPA: hypothetical protein DCY41_07680 [Opitutae bacterium]|nr:hypothetical protein [Opitutae bacterium]
MKVAAHNHGKLNLRLEIPKVSGNTVRLDGYLKFPNDREYHIFFEFTAPNANQAQINPRPFLLACLPIAMIHGLDLYCGHGVDKITRQNLTLWAKTYARWIPQRLQCVTLDIPDAPCIRMPGANGTLQAFSGGVDSCQTLLNRNPHRRHAGLMVHGFDIPLNRTAEFESAWKNSADILHDYAAESYQLRTNLRECEAVRPRLDWEKESHGIWLAAALACLEPWFEEVIIPSTFCTEALLIPWGSHPETDPLFSSEIVAYRQHGQDLDKLGKITELLAQSNLTDRLRVCWQLNHLPFNCGHCFKCIATQACLWISGSPRSAAFPNPCSISELANLCRLKNEMQKPNRYLITRMEAVARQKNRVDIADQLMRTLRGSNSYTLPRWLEWLKKYFQ